MYSLPTSAILYSRYSRYSRNSRTGWVSAKYDEGVALGKEIIATHGSEMTPRQRNTACRKTGGSLTMIGRHEEALEYFRKCWETVTTRGLGQSHVACGNFVNTLNMHRVTSKDALSEELVQEALKISEMTLREHPSKGQAWAYYALALFMDGGTAQMSLRFTREAFRLHRSANITQQHVATVDEALADAIFGMGQQRAGPEHEGGPRTTTTTRRRRRRRTTRTRIRRVYEDEERAEAFWLEHGSLVDESIALVETLKHVNKSGWPAQVRTLTIREADTALLNATAAVGHLWEHMMLQHRARVNRAMATCDETASERDGYARAMSACLSLSLSLALSLSVCVRPQLPYLSAD